MRMSSIQNSKTQTHSGDTSLFKTGNSQKIYICLSHAIELENTANQKARNPLHILRYATGSIPRKNPGVPRGLLIFPAKRSIEEPATCQNFHSEKILSTTKTWKKNTPVLTFILNCWNQTSNRKVNSMSCMG